MRSTTIIDKKKKGFFLDRWSQMWDIRLLIEKNYKRIIFEWRWANKVKIHIINKGLFDNIVLITLFKYCGNMCW